ncbi:integrin beta-7 isoform X3 [Arapaima gigas]
MHTNLLELVSKGVFVCQTMKWIWLTVAALLHFSRLMNTLESPRGCKSQPTCNQCLQSPGCAWCKQKDFLKSGESNERRCDTEEALKKRQCVEEDIINHQPFIDILKDNDLRNDQENVVQLRPQNLNLKLRVGVPTNFTVTFKRAEGYPIDLYYLMDLSYSMQDDLEKIKSLGQEILDTLASVTNNKVRIGFGSFVDKVAMPYVSTVKAKMSNPCPSRFDICQPAFSFRNVLRLTENPREFRERVSKQIISGNLDSPEGGFDAMMQVAVCQQNEIGWGNVTRILVYTSDDTFHMAGDGRLAGISKPNDGKCHLNSDGLYDKGNIYDYPSVGHLSQILSANNIQLIFAVTEKSVPTYKALSELIPQSVVGVLKNDSSNVVQLISEAYGNLSSTVLLEHQQVPQGLNISFKSSCGNGQSSNWEKSGKCHNVKIKQQVSFIVSVTASTCLPKTKTFFIKVPGIRDELKVTVQTLCDCKCGNPEKESTHCNQNGTLESNRLIVCCLLCSCNKGYLGQKCECKHEEAENMTIMCRQDESAQLCSGQGTCECGQCRCRGHHQGQFCECNDLSCERHNNRICNEQGTCRCGTCKCNANYTGSACECSKQTDNCENKHNVVCTNHGYCECNKCNCHAGFIGDVCKELVTPCKTYQECVTCTVATESMESLKKNCSKVCGSVKLVRVPGPKQFNCQNESITFQVTMDEKNGNVQISYTEAPGTVDMTSRVVGGSVTGVVLIGIAIIIIYRLLVEVYDRREYRRFLIEKQNVQWKENQNPLFKNATTTVFNPIHSGN